MIAELTLYGAPTGNCFRAAIALEEAKLVYSVKFVDLRHGDHLAENFLVINPAGKVPVLAQRDPYSSIILTQSNAIVFYADQLAPGLLAPRFEDPRRSIVVERYFYFVTDVISLSHAGAELRSAGFADAPIHLNEQAVKALAYAENFLDCGPWMAGERFSMADIAAYTVCVSSIDEIDWDSVPKLKKWFQRTAARPSILRGMSALWRHPDLQTVRLI